MMRKSSIIVSRFIADALVAAALWAACGVWLFERWGK